MGNMYPPPPPPVDGPPQPPYRQPLKPHRGSMVLAFGIIGIALAFCCPLVSFVFSILAVVFGSSDLREMRQGAMDRTGESMTQAGYICGFFGIGLGIIGTIMYVTRGVNVYNDLLRRGGLPFPR
jgi:hypothetical protein